MRAADAEVRRQALANRLPDEPVKPNVCLGCGVSPTSSLASEMPSHRVGKADVSEYVFLSTGSQWGNRKLKCDCGFHNAWDRESRAGTEFGQVGSDSLSWPPIALTVQLAASRQQIPDRSSLTNPSQQGWVVAEGPPLPNKCESCNRQWGNRKLRCECGASARNPALCVLSTPN